MAFIESVIIKDSGGTEVDVTASNALKVDGSAVTQPVSAAALPLPTGAATQATLAAIDAGIPAALGQTTMAASMPVVIASNQSAVPISGTVTIAANQSVNVAQINGVTPLMGNGVTGTGSPRVTLASDGTAISTVGFMSVKIDQTTDGTTNKVRATGTNKPSYGSTTVLAVTALQSLASSATAGWKSVRTSNVSALANDYEVMISLTTANTAPANDKAMYLYVIPWYTSDGGTTWFASSGGTTTLPTSADATYTIASPNNFRLLGVLNYTTQQMVVQDTFLLSNAFGSRMPDGFSFCVINFSGAALSTGCILDITPINDVLV